MKDNNFDTQEFEKVLRNKMNELSDSVDCFDKISARAFPKNYLDFSEGEFTVSDLENVTGIRRRLPLLKWAAFSVAAVLCIAFIPRTGITDRLLTNLVSNSDTAHFRQITAEIAEIGDSSDYEIFDVPLETYISSDVLITPGISCPFEESSEPDTMVRLFIKTIGGIPTNQLYAAEYQGTYSTENIVAAAVSEVTISEEEASRTAYNKPVFTYNEELLIRAVQQHYSVSDSALASYTRNCYSKDTNGIVPVTFTVLYGASGTTEDDISFYDIAVTNSQVTMTDRQKNIWQTSVYYNGKSAMPENDSSHFKHTPLFEADSTLTDNYTSWAYVLPFSAEDGRVSVKGGPGKIGIDRIDYSCGSISGHILTPFSDIDALSMRLYLDPSMLSDSGLRLEVFSCAMSSPAVFTENDLFASDDIMAALTQKEEELQRENAEDQEMLAAQQAEIQRNIEEEKKRLSQEYTEASNKQ